MTIIRKCLIYNNKLIFHVLLLIIFFAISNAANADTKDILRLQNAYPEHIHSIIQLKVTWKDGTVMPLTDGKTNKSRKEKLDNPSLADQVDDVHYQKGIPADIKSFHPLDDPGRIRYEPFFKKMYGNTKEEVEAKLIVIYWMPLFFGDKYPLLVTTVNDVDKKLVQISDELQTLVISHPEYLSYLENPGGTFKWRIIANTNRLSAHSFGMTIDINANISDYWQWDLQKEGRAIGEDEKLEYRNHIPWEIIPIFEKQGFIWGGKWYHYDTMHFEYRPELFD